VVVSDAFSDLYDRNGCYMLSHFNVKPKGNRNLVNTKKDLPRSKSIIKLQGDIVFEYCHDKGLFLFSITRSIFTMYPELDNALHANHSDPSKIEDLARKFIESVPHEQRRVEETIQNFLSAPLHLQPRNTAGPHTPVLVSRSFRPLSTSNGGRGDKTSKHKVSFSSTSPKSRNSSRLGSSGSTRSNNSTERKAGATIMKEPTIDVAPPLEQDMSKVSERIKRVRGQITNERRERRARMNDLLGIAKPKKVNMQEAGADS